MNVDKGAHSYIGVNSGSVSDQRNELEPGN